MLYDKAKTHPNYFTFQKHCFTIQLICMSGNEIRMALIHGLNRDLGEGEAPGVGRGAGGT